MSLSDCPKCWNTPCDCGHEYTLMSPEQRARILAAITSVQDGTYQESAPVPLAPPVVEESVKVEPTAEQVNLASALCAVRKRKLDADAAAPRDETTEYLATSPSWTCAACASVGPFKTIEHRVTGEPVEHDIECIACGSRDVRETMAEAFHAHIEVSSAHAEKLLAAIRKHRDQKGDDRCWLDDRELYQILPEGLADADLRLPPPEEMLANCKRYIACRHSPSETYVSSQREIERLQADNTARVVGLLACAADWAAEGQSLAAWVEHARARHVRKTERQPAQNEEHRQMIVLAIAELSLRRPGWEHALREIAKTYRAEEMFDGFRKTSSGETQA